MREGAHEVCDRASANPQFVRNAVALYIQFLFALFSAKIAPLSPIVPAPGPGITFHNRNRRNEPMVTIRLARGGARKRPYYNIVVADSRRAAGGRFIERVGFFNPVATDGDQRLRLDNERVQHWISHGAQPSERVRQLILHPERHRNPPSGPENASAVPAPAAKSTKAKAAEARAASAEAAPAEAKPAPAEAKAEAAEAKAEAAPAETKAAPAETEVAPAEVKAKAAPAEAEAKPDAGSKAASGKSETGAAAGSGKNA